MKLEHWKLVVGSSMTMLPLIVITAAIGWEKVMITRFANEHQYVLLISAVLIFFVKAVPEEIVYRGILQGAIKDKYGFIPALIGSAILYGVASLNDPAAWAFPNWHAMVNALLLGLACGVIYNKTKSLAVSAAVNTSASFLWWMMFARGGY